MVGQSASRRLIVLRSERTSAIPEIRRLREPVFFIRKWLPVALRRMTLPVPVSRNRWAAPRCDFIFGISLQASSLASAASAGGSGSAAATSAAGALESSCPAPDAFTWARLTGAKTMTMFRPSSFG